MAFDTARARMLFATGSIGGADSSVTWELSTTWQQVSAATSPTTRRFAALAYHAGLGKTVLMGGASGTTSLADAYEYTGTGWSLQPTHPTVRGYSSMVYDSARSKLVLYGGYSTTYLGDTWEY